MTDPQPSLSQDDIWRGIDFSGLVVVVGAGTGRLIQLLAEQVALAQGQMIVLSYQQSSLVGLDQVLPENAQVLLMQGRSRQLPLAAECVDLMVVNGVLREVPETHYGRFFEEIWRVLVQGGQLRVSDIVEPSEEPHSRAWAQRNALIRALGAALKQPTAVAVDVRAAALALRADRFRGTQALIAARLCPYRCLAGGDGTSDGHHVGALGRYARSRRDRRSGLAAFGCCLSGGCTTRRRETGVEWSQGW